MQHLPPKPDSPTIDSGHFLAYLTDLGIVVAGDTVVSNTDGSVDVETDDLALPQAWLDYTPPPVDPPTTVAIALIDEALALGDIEAIRAFLLANLIPRLFPEA